MIAVKILLIILLCIPIAYMGYAFVADVRSTASGQKDAVKRNKKGQGKKRSRR